MWGSLLFTIYLYFIHIQLIFDSYHIIAERQRGKTLPCQWEVKLQRGFKMENKKYYVVIATWYGIEDAYPEEYSGIRHETREAARQELIEAKDDINWDGFYIKEVQ